MAEMKYGVGFDKKKVKSSKISRYSDGYNYASLGCKMGDNEYMHVSYEWKGDDIPEFALMVMDIMKNISESASLNERESLERAGKYFIDRAAKMKKEDKEDKEDKKDKKDK
jgi:hypothetical protein